MRISDPKLEKAPSKKSPVAPSRIVGKGANPRGILHLGALGNGSPRRPCPWRLFPSSGSPDGARKPVPARAQAIAMSPVCESDSCSNAAGNHIRDEGLLRATTGPNAAVIRMIQTA